MATGPVGFAVTSIVLSLCRFEAQGVWRKTKTAKHNENLAFHSAMSHMPTSMSMNDMAVGDS